ncbi:MAG: EAL domain-containing protein, partial [Alphaproteobacteria bacterium]|nr:EAL domain-containing protein [Alphaproteobacteria bacterium]
FGVGQSSFRKLRGLPADFLKLDGAICRDLASDADNQYFVKAMIDLARKFGIRTIAECVETTEDADHLRVWGVDLLQGNLYGEVSLTEPWQKSGGSEAFAAAEPLPFVRPSEVALSALPDEPEEIHIPASPPLAAAAPLIADEPAESEDVIAAYEDEVEGELSKLRAAIAALDRSFRSEAAGQDLRRAG